MIISKAGMRSVIVAAALCSTLGGWPGSLSAQDAPAKPPAAAAGGKTSAQKPAVKSSPFPDDIKSGVACEVFGPCGKCDCSPPTAGKQAPGPKQK